MAVKIKYKNFINLLLLFILTIILMLVNNSFAGTIENNDGFFMYKLSSGEYAKSTWIWIDTNNDSVKECYRFDEDGHIAKNYIGHDGRATNEKGQLIENGFVIKKLLSGNIIKGEGEPYVYTDKVETNVIYSKKSNVIYNLPFGVERNNETILTTEIKDKAMIPIDETINTNIIYAIEGVSSNKTKNSSKNKNKNKNIVVGKNIINYIKSKNNAKEVEKAIIYGNKTWEDVIELRGNNSSIKINTKNFNYIYFEVAEENHLIDKENEELLSLEIYADGKLIDTLDEFVESEPQFEEIEELDAKEVELKVIIAGKNKQRRVYINNGRLKKIRDKDE